MLPGSRKTSPPRGECGLASSAMTTTANSPMMPLSWEYRRPRRENASEYETRWGMVGRPRGSGMGSVIESSCARLLAPQKLGKGTLSTSSLRCGPGNFSGVLRNVSNPNPAPPSVAVGYGGLGSLSGEKHFPEPEQSTEPAPRENYVINDPNWKLSRAYLLRPFADRFFIPERLPTLIPVRAILLQPSSRSR
jgi:hypothetical protein